MSVHAVKKSGREGLLDEPVIVPGATFGGIKLT